MFASRFLVAAFVALGAMTASSRAVAASTDDLFTGTLSIEQRRPILTRCDAAGNRYQLTDRRADRSRPLSAYATPRDDVVDVIGTANDDGTVTTLTVQNITPHSPRPMCHLAEIDAPFTTASAEPVDPKERFDLPALLECRSDIGTAARFRNWLDLGSKVLKLAGLTKVAGHNFVAEYRTAVPITVFGHKTNVVALHPDGVLAVLSDVTPQALARTLSVPIMLSTDPFIAQKVIETSPGADAKPGALAARVLTVTSREGLAGMAVAGCLYLSNGQGNM